MYRELHNYMQWLKLQLWDQDEFTNFFIHFIDDSPLDYYMKNGWHNLKICNGGCVSVIMWKT